MDNLAEKIAEILGNKENMDTIKNLSSLLDNQSSPSGNIDPPKREEPIESKSEPIPTDILKTVTKIMPILSSMNKEDESTRFLYALKPLLSSKRQVKIDESIKMVQMFKILPVLKGQGIL